MYRKPEINKHTTRKINKQSPKNFRNVIIPKNTFVAKNKTTSVERATNRIIERNKSKNLKNVANVTVLKIIFGVIKHPLQ